MFLVISGCGRSTPRRWNPHGAGPDQRFEAGRQVREFNPDTVTLVAALRQISASQRRAIVLYHLIGLSVREIAQETGSSRSAVKAQPSRGRQALAPLLGVEELREARHHG